MVMIVVHCKFLNIVQIVIKVVGVRNGMAGTPQILRWGKGNRNLLKGTADYKGGGA